MTISHTRRREDGPSASYCGPEQWLAEWRKDLPKGWIVSTQKRMTVMVPHNMSPAEVTHVDWIFEVVIWPNGHSELEH